MYRIKDSFFVSKHTLYVLAYSYEDSMHVIEQIESLVIVHEERIKDTCTFTTEVKIMSFNLLPT